MTGVFPESRLKRVGQFRENTQDIAQRKASDPQSSEPRDIFSGSHMNNSDLSKLHRALKQHYQTHAAPIVDLVEAQTHDPFHVLVATILSARTRDETTAAVCKRLFRVVRSPRDLQRLSQRRLERLIFPVGFFRTKARHLKQLPLSINKLFKGQIPDSIEALCKLPGVGRKTANLVLAVAFNRPAICVDVHVHRICNRLGIIRTSTPLQTEMALRRILPVQYWKTWNSFLVAYGQTTCTPRNPKCGECTIAAFCRQVGVRPPRAARTKRTPLVSTKSGKPTISRRLAKK